MRRRNKRFITHFNSDARLGILQKYEYKFSNTGKLRRASGLKNCITQLALADPKEETTETLN